MELARDLPRAREGSNRVLIKGLGTLALLSTSSAELWVGGAHPARLSGSL